MEDPTSLVVEEELIAFDVGDYHLVAESDRKCITGSRHRHKLKVYNHLHGEQASRGCHIQTGAGCRISTWEHPCRALHLREPTRIR
jgi:hypothetical protein